MTNEEHDAFGLFPSFVATLIRVRREFVPASGRFVDVIESAG